MEFNLHFVSELQPPPGGRGGTSAQDQQQRRPREHEEATAKQDERHCPWCKRNPLREVPEAAAWLRSFHPNQRPMVGQKIRTAVGRQQQPQGCLIAEG